MCCDVRRGDTGNDNVFLRAVVLVVVGGGVLVVGVVCWTSHLLVQVIANPPIARSPTQLLLPFWQQPPGIPAKCKPKGKPLTGLLTNSNHRNHKDWDTLGMASNRHERLGCDMFAIDGVVVGVDVVVR